MLKANFHQVQPAEHTRRKYSTLGSFYEFCSIFQPMATSGAFPVGRLTCVLSALPTSPALGETPMWLVLFCFVFEFFPLLGKAFPVNLRLFPFSWQKGDRPDNDPLSHAASRQKKRCLNTLGCPNVRVSCFLPFRSKSRMRLEGVSATVLGGTQHLIFRWPKPKRTKKSGNVLPHWKWQ